MLGDLRGIRLEDVGDLGVRGFRFQRMAHSELEFGFVKLLGPCHTMRICFSTRQL